jgi:hypothetical protein
MDALDKIILSSYDKIVIKSLGIGSGNLSNSIQVIWGSPQELSVLKSPPFSRLSQWFFPGEVLQNEGKLLHISYLPETVDANDIAIWLAKELSNQGKTVQLLKWVAPDTFQSVEV